MCGGGGAVSGFRDHFIKTCVWVVTGSKMYAKISQTILCEIFLKKLLG